MLLPILLFLLGHQINAKDPCDPESFQFVGSPREVENFGVFIFRIENAQEIGCAVNTTYEWTILEISDKKLRELPKLSRALKNQGPGKWTENEVDMHELLTAVHEKSKKFALRVTLMPDKSHYPSYRLWYFGIKSLPTEYIEIRGGVERTHWLDGNQLWLNISGIGDQKLPEGIQNPSWECIPPFEGVIPPRTFKWMVSDMYLKENTTHTCHVTAEKSNGQKLSATQTVHIRSITGMPQIAIKCIQNCEEANPYAETILQLLCSGDCNGKVDWNVKPFGNKFIEKSVLLEDNQICFRPGTFNFDSTMDFIANLGEAIANYKIHFKLQEPKLKILCNKNCDPNDVQYEMSFSVSCELECANLSYQWEVQPHVPWHLNSPSNDVISFPAYSLPRDTEVHLRVKAISEAFFTFSTHSYNKAPLKLWIECVENCGTSDPDMPVELAVNISSVGENGLKWTFNPPGPGFHWYDHSTNGNRSVVVPPFTYNDGDTVEITVSDGQSTDSASIPFKAVKPTLFIKCIDNCIPDASHPNSHKPVIVNVTCSSHCENHPYIWRLEPPPKKSYNNNGTFFSIPAEFYKEGETVRISAEKGRGKATFSVAFKELKPDSAIACIENCIFPHDPLRDTVLEAKCKKACDGLELFWKIKPSPEPWYRYVELNNNNKTLILKGGTFKNNSFAVSFELFGKKEMKEYKMDAIGYIYDYRTVNFTIECIGNCNNSWTSLTTTLAINCAVNCENVGYVWSLAPLSKTFKWAKSIKLSSDNKTLNVLPNAFNDKDVITFKAKATLFDDDWRETRQQSELKITFEELIPKLELTCQPIGCNTTVNRLTNNFLRVECLRNCQPNEYSWRILPYSFKWDENIIRGIGNKSLEVLPRTFENGINATFSVNGGKTTASAYLVFEDPAPELEIKCTENCKLSDPRKTVKLRVQCNYLCENIDSFKWNLDPKPNKKGGTVIAAVQSKELIIMSESYKDGDVVNVTTTWGLGKNSILLPFIEPAPHLEIVCVRNCKYIAALATSFEVHCTSQCISKMKYEWKLTPKPYKEIYNNEKVIVTLPAKTYEPYDKLVLNVTFGKGHTAKEVVFKDSEPSLHIECIANCDHNGRANPRKQTTFRVSCQTDCEGFKYNWTLDPSPIALNKKKDLLFNDDYSVMSIRANLYKNTTVVRVCVSARECNMSIDVTFLEPSPILKMVCVSNCGYPNPEEALEVNVTCLAHCEYTAKYFTWHLTPILSGFSWKKHVKLGKSNETLTIAENVYKDNDKVLIIVRSRGAEAQALFTYTLPPPIIKIYCRPSCNKADPLEILNLEVKCLKFCNELLYKWDITPTLPGFLWNLNVTESKGNNSIKLAPNTFVDGSITNVIVAGSKGARAVEEINFVEKIPQIRMLCATNDCVFSPKNVAEFTLNCTANCKELLSYHCNFEPPPHDPIQQSGSAFTIPANVYAHNEEVHVVCSARKGSVEGQLKFRENPSDQKCVISPENGTSGITHHTIECERIRENVTYRVYQRIPLLKGRGVLLWQGLHSFISDILLFPAVGDEIHILVGSNAKAKVTLSINEKEYITGKKEELNVVKKLILENFRQLLRDKNHQKAIQLAASLDSALEQCPALFEAHYRRHILENLLAESDSIDPAQMLSLITKMTFKNYTQNAIAHHLLMEGVRTSMEKISNTAASYDNETMKDIASQAIVTVKRISVDARYSPEPKILMRRSRGTEPTDIPSNLLDKGWKRHMFQVSKDAALALDNIADVYKQWEERTTLCRKGVTMANMYKAIESFEEKYKLKFRCSKSYAILKPFQNKERKFRPLVHSKNITYKGVAFRNNLFWWDETVSSAKGEMLYYGITIDNTKVRKAEIELHIQLIEDVNSGSLAGSVSSNDQHQVYEYQVPVHSTLQLVIKGETLQVIIANWLPNLENIQSNGIKVVKEANFSFFSEYHKVYIGISGKGNYYIEFYAIQCFAWHSDTWQWDRSSCRPVPQHSDNAKNSVVCQCERLSMFTANKFTPKYSLRLLTEEPVMGQQKHYWYVTITTGIVAILILIALIFAIIQDFKIQKQYKINYLPDNYAIDRKLYLIAVQTGMWSNSGTTARIGIQIEGAKGVSRAHLLNANDGSLLHRNSAQAFALYSPTDLGKIMSLRVWHDSFGKQPHWYCDTIVVRDVSNRRRYVFVICRWFSLVFGNCKTEGIFHPKKKSSKVCFVTRLQEITRANHHCLGYLTDRETPHSTKRNVIVSAASILLTMLIVLLMTARRDSPNTIFKMALAIITASVVSVIVASFLDFLFRKSKP